MHLQHKEALIRAVRNAGSCKSCAPMSASLGCAAKGEDRGELTLSHLSTTALEAAHTLLSPLGAHSAMKSTGVTSSYERRKLSKQRKEGTKRERERGQGRRLNHHQNAPCTAATGGEHPRVDKITLFRPCGLSHPPGQGEDWFQWPVGYRRVAGADSRSMPSLFQGKTCRKSTKQ